MNYYIQGDAAKAEEIRAAFEKLGYDISWSEGCANPDVINIGVERNCAKYVVAETSEYIKDLIKTHPDYKELKLPIEPNFKVGDWVVRGRGFVYEPSLITEIRDYYICELLNGERVTYTLNDVHKNFHLWTIADAKDGDVLATNSIICVFKKLDKDGYYIISPCIYTVKDGLEVIDDENDSIGSYGFKPATKEDRELLFCKMKEAGYTWDEKKKELHKIQHYDIANFKPKQWVLTRDTSEWDWELTMFAYLNSDGGSKFTCINGVTFKQCIPLNDDTKHLLGTTDMPSEEYINW